MLNIGCDFHTRCQQIAMLNYATGELLERRLEHENGGSRGVPPWIAEAGAAGGPALLICISQNWPHHDGVDTTAVVSGS